MKNTNETTMENANVNNIKNNTTECSKCDCFQSSDILEWEFISELERSMDSILNLTCDIIHERYFTFSRAKELLLVEADEILDKYIEGLKDVDSELAGKVETCIKSIVEEIKPIKKHDDFDWDEFKDYDIEDILAEVNNLIVKHEKEIKDRYNRKRGIDNNYKVICEFLIKNGIGHEYTDCNGDVRVDRSRTLDIEGFGGIDLDGEEVKLNYPTVVFSRKCGEIDGKLVFNADGMYWAGSIDVDDEYAEIFAEAINNGDICPLPIEKVDYDI